MTDTFRVFKSYRRTVKNIVNNLLNDKKRLQSKLENLISINYFHMAACKRLCL